jgi:hypothetical protein
MRRFLLAAAVTTAVLLGPGATAALAQEIPPAEDASALAPSGALTLTAFHVHLVVVLLIPVATGIVSRWIHNTTALQIITAAISGIVALVTVGTQLDGTAIISASSLQYAFVDFLVASAGYLMIYKPHQLNARFAKRSAGG